MQILNIIGPICLILSIIINYKIIRNKKILDSLLKGPKIVVIGGGTGQSVFLRGLKKYTHNITAIVTVADDGGGSGILREDLNMLPPGDIRNCILALANIEPTMEKVMQYRFTEGRLKGQSLGNLFLAAMNGIYGNFETAVSKISEIFAVSGKVLPVTDKNIKLVAMLENGNIVKGESNIPKEVKKQGSKIKKVYLEPENTNALKDVIYEIENANIIVMGPGSLYTSIIPNLIIDEVKKTIEKAKCQKVYICNIMTQPGESDNYDVYDHVRAIIDHTSKDMIDSVIVNDERICDEDLRKYTKDGASQVLLHKKQIKKLNSMGINIIQTNLVEIKNSYIRHDSDKLAKIIMKLSVSRHLPSKI